MRPPACPQDNAALAQQQASGWVPRVGQDVFVPRLSKYARVVAVNAATQQLTLQAGMLKLTAACDEVRERR